jgi:redox-regulated HSP33 family molecular chaperone
MFIAVTLAFSHDSKRLSTLDSQKQMKCDFCGQAYKISKEEVVETILNGVA